MSRNLSGEVISLITLLQWARTLIRRMGRNLAQRVEIPRQVFPRQTLRGQGIPMGTVLALRMLMEALPVLVSQSLLWSQVLVLESNLGQLLQLPEDETHLLIWSDDLLLSITLATME